MSLSHREMDSSTFPYPPGCLRSLSLLILFKHKVICLEKNKMALKLKSPQRKPAVREKKCPEWAKDKLQNQLKPEEAAQGLNYGFGIV